MEGRILEGVWDCTYCGTAKIRGSVYKCPRCGRQRDKDITFYLDDKTNFVSEEKAKDISRNPDWLCSYCDGLNPDGDLICRNCGATKEDSEHNYFTNKAKRLSAKQQFQTCSTSEKEIVDKEKDEEKVSDAMERKTPWYKNKKILIGISASILSVLMVLGLLFVFLPKMKTVTVQSFSWERITEVQEYKTVQESNWTLPAGGRLQYTAEEIRSYNHVIDHYETKTRTRTEQVLDHYETYVSGYRDLGNGHFQEILSQRPVYRTETITEQYQEPVYKNVPIYDTKYYYEIERWVHKENKTTRGNDQDPYWYTGKIRDNERLVNSTEAYQILVITEDGEEKTFSVSFDKWKSMSIGQMAKMWVHFNGTADLITEGDAQ